MSNEIDIQISFSWWGWLIVKSREWSQGGSWDRQTLFDFSCEWSACFRQDQDWIKSLLIKETDQKSDVFSRWRVLSLLWCILSIELCSQNSCFQISNYKSYIKYTSIYQCFSLSRSIKIIQSIIQKINQSFRNSRGQPTHSLLSKHFLWLVFFWRKWKSQFRQI